jgi:GT2 family glycosyltransferase
MLAMSTPHLWIVVPVFNRVESIFSFVRQMCSQSFQDFKLIVIDHGTLATDYSSLDDCRITVLRESPDLWWTGAVNAGVTYVSQQSCSRHDLILVINDDVHVDATYLQSLVDLATDHPGSIIGSISVDESTGEVLSANFSLSKLKATFVPNYYGCPLSEIPDTCLSSDILPGRGMLVPRAVFDCVGMFLEADLPHYGADNEFSYRAKKAGYDLIVSKNCIVRTPAEVSPAPWKGRLNLARDHLFGRKSKGNLPTLLVLSRCYFRPPYDMYYFIVNAILKILSTAKHCFR